MLRSLIRLTVLVLLVLSGVVGLGQAAAGTIYFSDRTGATIRRGDMNGGAEAEVFLSAADGLVTPQGLGIDPVAGKLYWGDSGARKIRRINLDGTQSEDLVDSGLTFPADLELDLGAGRMYWTDLSQGEIRSANFDGSDVKVVWSNLALPYFFDLDPARGKIYWAENDNTLVYVANMDGTAAPTQLNVGLSRIRDIGVDFDGGKMYWGDRAAHTVHRANLDGTGVETLFDSADGLDRPHGLELDVAEGMIYFTDTRTYSVNRARMDGSGPIEVLYSGLPDAWDVELLTVPEPSTLWMTIVGIACVLLLRARSRTNVQ